MVKTRVSKPDAARRQINAAIRMTLDGEDPVAILTVAKAAEGLVRGICQRRGDIESYLRFTDWIAPGHEGEFLSALNASANFLKHADRDPNKIHELDETEADFVLLLASKWYVDLGFEASDEMRTFAAWFSMVHPNAINPNVKTELAKAGVLDQVDAMIRAARGLPRSETFKAARMSLELTRKAPKSRPPGVLG